MTRLSRSAVACVVVALCLGAGHAHQVGDRIMNGRFEITHVARGEEMPELSHLTKRLAVSVFGDKFDLGGGASASDEDGGGVAPLQDFLEVSEGMGNGGFVRDHYAFGPEGYQGYHNGMRYGAGVAPAVRAPAPAPVETPAVNEAGLKLQEVNYAVPNGFEPYPNKYSPIYKGAGSFGAVFTVREVSTEKLFAAKLARPNAKKGQQYLTEADVRDAQMECDRGRKWAHKHVMNCYQVAVIPSPYPNAYDGIYMVMEDSGKMNLNQAAQRGLVTVPGAIQVIWQTISGLNYIRSNFGHIHHDMKSDNIMLRDPEIGDFTVKVIDLGGAESCHYDNPHNTGVGTPFYAPPEWPNKRFVGECDSYDLYALGMMLRDGLFSKYGEAKRLAHSTFLPSCFRGDMPRCAREQIRLHFPHHPPEFYAKAASDLTKLRESRFNDFMRVAYGTWVPMGRMESEREDEMIREAIKFMWRVTQPNPVFRGILSNSRTGHYELFKELFPRPANLDPMAMGKVAPVKHQPHVDAPVPAEREPAPRRGPVRPAAEPMRVNDGANPGIIGIRPAEPQNDRPVSGICTRTEIRKEMTERGMEKQCVFWVDAGCPKAVVFDLRINCEFGYGNDMDGQGRAQEVEFSLGHDQKFKPGNDPIWLEQCRGYRLSSCRVTSESWIARRR